MTARCLNQITWGSFSKVLLRFLAFQDLRAWPLVRYSPLMSEEQHSDTGLGGMVVPVTPLQQNCSILWCTKTNKAAVVDPGGDLENILGVVEQNSVELEKILVTHAHIDHAGGVAELAERFELPVEGPHPEDQFWIDRLEEAGGKYGISARSFVPERWLDGNDTVTIGEQMLEVRHCPGHTPGHVIFYHEPSQLAAVGDVLFQGSIGRSDFPRGNYGQLVESIVSQLWPLGDDVTFIPGHGQLSTFGHERKTNPFVSDLALGRG